MAVEGDGSAFTLDGTSWSAPYRTHGQLSAVSCASATFCVAINFDGAVRWH